MSKPEKTLAVSIIIVLTAIGSLYAAVRIAGSKVTNFEECEKAGWLIRGIVFYDGNGSIEKECILWSGQHFTKP